MRFRLVPRDEDFFRFFAEQATFVKRSAEQLEEIFQKPQHAYALYPELKKTESDADDVKRRVIKRLDTAFVTPLEREDVRAFSDKLDDAVDIAEAVGLRIMLFAKRFGGNLSFFSPMRDKTARLLDALKKAAAFAPEIVDCVQSGDRQGAEKNHKLIHDLEKDGDKSWQGEGGILDYYIGKLALTGGEGTATKQDLLFFMWMEMVCHEIERAIDLMKGIVDLAYSIIDKNS